MKRTLFLTSIGTLALALTAWGGQNQPAKKSAKAASAPVSMRGGGHAMSHAGPSMRGGGHAMSHAGPSMRGGGHAMSQAGPSMRGGGHAMSHASAMRTSRGSSGGRMHTAPTAT